MLFMSKDERLAHLVQKLAADERYASGSRRFPDYISTDDGVAIAAVLGNEFDRGAERRAQSAAAQGMHIACRPGCNSCCTVILVVYKSEALRIARFLMAEENRDARATFLANYSTWRSQLGDELDALPELFKAGKQREYDALHMALWRKNVMCAFNHQGRCTIYPVRPLGCRNAHALDTSERCVPDPPSGRPPSAAQFLPLEDFLRNATRVLHAVHNATAKQRHHQEALCSAVHKLLA